MKEGAVWVAGPGGWIGGMESSSGGLTFHQMALGGDVECEEDGLLGTVPAWA